MEKGSSESRVGITRHGGIGLASLAFAVNCVLAATPEPEQITGLAGWTTEAVFTIGESSGGYTPPGIPDGMGAFDRGDEVVIVVNHELNATSGYEFTLTNGATLRGARISKLTFDRETRALLSVEPAFDTIYNRAGSPVTGPADLDFGGLARLCSAGYVAAGQAGFVDDIFFTGEETGSGNGGSEFILDVAGETLYAAPWMGRAAWESAAALDVPGINETHVAVLIGDDRGGAPLLLYVGEKQTGGDFLARNGLANGRLYMWKADNGDTSPEDWSGTGTSRSGHFVEVMNYNDGSGDPADFDELGFATIDYLDEQQADLGAFRFSRPEDVHTNPQAGKGNQVAFASTGRSSLFPSDSWGTTYLVDVKISRGNIRNGTIAADITILYDGDDAGAGQKPGPDFGIRSPDNLVWAEDGMIYVQEDRSVGGFGAVSGQEASIWELNPFNRVITRIARVDRSAVPSAQQDTDPTDLGDWETSGIIDVTSLFGAQGERLLFLNTQAHSLRGSPSYEATVGLDLVQGGQLLFMSKEQTTGEANSKPRGTANGLR
jgi:hypothetical protein